MVRNIHITYIIISIVQANSCSCLRRRHTEGGRVTGERKVEGRLWVKDYIRREDMSVKDDGNMTGEERRGKERRN